MRKILKASAGTGKTYRLSLEYVASLLQGENFTEIAVMTFTRKATAEIRKRIFKHIADIIEKGEKSKVFASLVEIYPGLKLNKGLLARKQREMLLNKDQINIFTIDSFINKIFRKVIAPYLDIYEYEIIEEDRNEEIIAEVFKKVLDSKKDFQLMENFLRENTERNIDIYLDLIRKILNNRWKFLIMEYTPRPQIEAGDMVVNLDECLDLLKEVAAARGEEFNEDYFVSDFKSVMDNYRYLRKKQEKEELIGKHMAQFYKKSFWNGNKLRRKSLAAIKESLEQNYEYFLTELAHYIYNEEIIPYEKQIYEFSSRIFAIYDHIKFKQKSFTHNDISNYCYKYLFNKELDLFAGTEVSAYFYDLIGSEIKNLFIDEFQDTSILQWKILKPLIDSSQRVIAVGDEKQSIYGWRGGEKELFAHLEEILSGESETLDVCFRSQQRIINFVNRFFSNLTEDWEYGQVNHLPQKKGGYVEVMIGGEKAIINTGSGTFQKKSAEEKKYLHQLNQNLSKNLKQKIAECIDHKISDYSSTAVLARSNDDLMEIAEELDKLAIPYILESQDSLIEHEAVKPLYFLLHYLYSDDFFQLVKFLRSDVVGINNSVLKYLLTAKTDIENYFISEEKILAYDDLECVLSKIKSLGKLNYSELTDCIINESGILDLYARNTGALKNLYYFFKLMRDFDSLPEFMEYLEENRDSDYLKQVGVQKADAIKLLTIHKAKGLTFTTEFFYWKPGTRSNNSNEIKLYVDFDKSFQQVEDYFLTDSRYREVFDYLDIDFAREEEKRAQMEEINNVYVALTRPAENLFLYIESPRQLKDAQEGRYWKERSYEFYENAILSGAGVCDLTELVEAKSRGKFHEKPKEKEEFQPGLPDLSPYFRTEEIPESILIEYNKNKEFSQKIEGNLRRLDGLAVHYYLEHIKYNHARECEYARNVVQGKYGNILGPERLKNIFMRAESFIKNNPQYFAQNKEIFTEYRLQDKATGENYRIDRLLVDKEKREMEIIDYKTGALREEIQLEKYEDLLRQQVDSKYTISSKFVEV